MNRFIAAAALLTALISAPAFAADTPAKPKPAEAPKPIAIIDPAKAAADADFSIQGEYAGELKGEKRGIQVIALGDHKFHAVGYEGGLPGDGWDPTKQKWEGDGELDAATGAATLKGPANTGSAVIKGGVMTVKSEDGQALGEIKKVTRQSPTIGAKPPAGATIFFDGKTNDFTPGTTEGDLLVQGQNSKTKFQSG